MFFEEKKQTCVHPSLIVSKQMIYFRVVCSLAISFPIVDHAGLGTASMTKRHKNGSQTHTRKTLLRDLPIELGGMCTSFLYVEHQCRLMHTSRQFQRYTKYGFKFERSQLVVFTNAPKTVRDKTWEALHDDSTKKLIQMSNRAQRTKAVCYCPKYLPGPDISPSALTLEVVTMVWPISREHPFLTLPYLAAMKCAKHLTSLSIIMSEAAHDDLGRSFASRFENLQCVSIRFNMRSAKHIEDVHDVWGHVREAYVTLVVDRKDVRSKNAYSPTLAAFSLWKGLHMLWVPYMVPPPQWMDIVDNPAVAALITALPRHIPTINILVFAQKGADGGVGAMSAEKTEAIFRYVINELHRVFPNRYVYELQRSESVAAVSIVAVRVSVRKYDCR